MPLIMSAHAQTVINTLGLTDEAKGKLHKLNLIVKTTPSGILFVRVPPQTGTAAKMTMSIPTMSAVLGGKASAETLDALQKELTLLIDKIIETYPDLVEEDAGEPEVMPAGVALKKTGALAKLPPKKAKEAPKPATPATDFPIMSKEDMMTAPRVPLAQATQMYQPVKGTSNDSRYFMIASTDDLRIAIRRKHNQVSLRVEGAGLKKHKKALAEAGFDNTEPKNYLSLHLTATGDVLQRRIVGSVLLGLGLELRTPLPDLSIIPAT